MCVQILMRDGELAPEAYSTFLRMGSGTGADPTTMGPLSEWMSPNIWTRVKDLEALRGIYPLLSNLGEDMQNDSDLWQAWFDTERPEEVPCPAGFKVCACYSSFGVERGERKR
jgi:hypothetical protein